jgi:uncharacterized protein
MKPTLASLALAALLASAVTGCSPAQSHGASSPHAALADAGLVVSGEGSARAASDCAVLRLGISAFRPTMADARQASASAQSRVLAALTSRGIAALDVQTEQLSLAPEFDYQERTRVLRGYNATNIVRVMLRNPAIAGEIVDATVTAGGDDTRVDGISFELEDDAPLRIEARTKAIEDARTKAAQLAKELGVELGEVLSIEEVASGPIGPPAYARFEAKAAAADPTQVASGSIEATVSVRVRWAIRPRS